MRALFAHLDEHGAIGERQAAQMLGGRSRLRRFSAKFDQFALHAPFAVRIDVIDGVKRYVREGRRL